jgi:hypothetical protein
MNEKVVFVVGIIVFAITIYGVVIAGGIALTKSVLDQDSSMRPPPPKPGESGRNVKY